MIENTLTDLGLNGTEVKIYMTLLSLRSVPASTLSRHVGIPRTTTKYSCEQLVQKGLAKRINRNNCWFYSPCPPSRLQSLLETRRQRLEEQSSHLDNVIGELEDIYRRNEVTPRIQFFEGAEGIIEMMNDVLRSKEEIYGTLHLSNDMHPVIKKYFEKTYLPERKRTKAPAWMLFNDNEITRKYQSKDLDMNRISMLCPENEFPFESCLHIYGNKVAFYSYQSAMMTGVIIQDSHIRQLQFSLFKMAWKLTQGMKSNERYKKVELNTNHV